METVAEDVLECISTFLDTKSLYNLRKTCNGLSNVGDDWKERRDDWKLSKDMEKLSHVMDGEVIHIPPRNVFKGVIGECTNVYDIIKNTQVSISIDTPIETTAVFTVYPSYSSNSVQPNIMSWNLVEGLHAISGDYFAYPFQSKDVRKVCVRTNPPIGDECIIWKVNHPIPVTTTIPVVFQVPSDWQSTGIVPGTGAMETVRIETQDTIERVDIVGMGVYGSYKFSIGKKLLDTMWDAPTQRPATQALIKLPRDRVRLPVLNKRLYGPIKKQMMVVRAYGVEGKIPLRLQSKMWYVIKR